MFILGRVFRSSVGVDRIFLNLFVRDRFSFFEICFFVKVNIKVIFFSSSLEVERFVGIFIV